MIYIKGWGVFFEVKIIWQPEELEAISGQGLDQEKDKKLSVRVRVPEKGEQVDRGGVDTKCKRRIGIAKQASFPCRPESSPAEFTQWKLPSLMQLRWEVRSTGKPRPWGRALPSCHHGTTFQTQQWHGVSPFLHFLFSQVLTSLLHSHHGYYLIGTLPDTVTMTFASQLQ